MEHVAGGGDATFRHIVLHRSGTGGSAGARGAVFEKVAFGCIGCDASGSKWLGDCGLCAIGGGATSVSRALHPVALGCTRVAGGCMDVAFGGAGRGGVGQMTGMGHFGTSWDMGWTDFVLQNGRKGASISDDEHAILGGKDGWDGACSGRSAVGAYQNPQ